MNKICIWMNIPSHYQTAFFQALDARDDINLKVIYLNEISQKRAAEGWSQNHDYKTYEVDAKEAVSVRDMLNMVPDYMERIHIISSLFSSKLIDCFCENGIRWCHWSEMPGIRLAGILGYHTRLFRLLHPVTLFCKRKQGRQIRNYALGAFVQGKLARHAFRLMGVPKDKIADLYYTPAPLKRAHASLQVIRFSSGRKIFLTVGALCKRKGIGDLLKAFSKLKSEDWGLVLCGLDRANGAYHKFAKKLNIEDRVLFLGAYPSARIAEVYSSADAFVLASRFDGWGAVLNEAASLGLPLIGTDLCGGAWHVVESGVTGYRVKAGAKKNLMEAMGQYVTDPDKCKIHGNAARKHYFNNFTPEKNAERLVHAIRKWEYQ